MCREAKYYTHATNCYYCGRKYGECISVYALVGKWLLKTKDHIIPKSKGGINKKQNYISACCDCNLLKANMDVKEFAVYLNRINRDPQFIFHPMKPYFKQMIFNSWKLYNKKVKLFKRHAKHTNSGC